ncbi:hypothetical protein DSO57_1014045 [Entomophthora muscae]|uniref:Uncharacterized protein n=1 Tax=Entomophthora muscae TaxID=34485 RepID=A0ACC2SV59_9FUNG|nr:hypothetical protein DSO57_1014045 [Entomophthora muscae]
MPAKKSNLKQFPVLFSVKKEPAVYTENNELTSIPNYMLPGLTKVTPEPTYTQKAQPEPKQPKKKMLTTKEPEVNIFMNLPDKKVCEILAQISLEEELSHNIPNVERYIIFFSTQPEQGHS